MDTLTKGTHSGNHNLYLCSFCLDFFRAETLEIASSYTLKILNTLHWGIPEVRPWYILILTLIMVFIEWIGKENKCALNKVLFKQNHYLQLCF
jgi:hypothetical protein